MILLQLSSAQGPDECCLAVKKALDCLTKEAAREKVSLTRLETEPDDYQTRCVLRWSRWTAKKLWLSVNVGAARYCGFVPARIVRTMGEKTGTSALGAFPPTSTYSLMRFVSRLCALPARVGSTLIKPTRQCGPRTWRAGLA